MNDWKNAEGAFLVFKKDLLESLQRLEEVITEAAKEEKSFRAHAVTVEAELREELRITKEQLATLKKELHMLNGLPHDGNWE